MRPGFKRLVLGVVGWGIAVAAAGGVLLGISIGWGSVLIEAGVCAEIGAMTCWTWAKPHPERFAVPGVEEELVEVNDEASPTAAEVATVVADLDATSAESRAWREAHGLL